MLHFRIDVRLRLTIPRLTIPGRVPIRLRRLLDPSRVAYFLLSHFVAGLASWAWAWLRSWFTAG